MSYHRPFRKAVWSRNINIGFFVAILFLASGCGFEPIHGSRSQASLDILSTFQINPIPDRTGQMLRNELVEQLHANANVVTPRFYLSVSIIENLQQLGIQKDDVATRANLILNANYKITKRKGGDSVYAGRARSVNSYDILTSDFATLSALRDARRRGVRALAENIKTRISVWLIQTGGG